MSRVGRNIAANTSGGKPLKPQTVPQHEEGRPKSAPAPKTEVKIASAKGRPMLVWVGKRPLSHVTAFPAQHVESFDPTIAFGSGTSRPGFWNDWPAAYPKGGLLFHGDNKEVLAHLLANGFRGKVNLIYIDPPFDSGADYVRKVSLRGVKGTAKLDGEHYTLGEQIQYTDIWANDNYLQFMYERLLLLKELLAEDGSIYLHCDWHKSQHLRVVMDEVFGSEKCLNEIIWKRTSAKGDSSTFNHIHDLILLYSKGENFRFNQLLLPHDQNYIDRYYTYTEPDGRRFATIDATQAGLRTGPSGQPWRGFSPASKGNHWKFDPKELEQLDAEGRIYWPEKIGGWPRLKSYLDEAKGAAIQSIWTDIKAVNSQAEERGDYPTQKPEALLDRIIRASSNPGDLVLDCFIGSGTTAAVAQKLGRRWIGCDINKGAIQTTAKRLQGVIREQIVAVEEEKARNAQGKLIDMGEDEDNESPEPAQLAFTVWRVNDYDLAIQHNEAVNLACEHIGIERMRTDAYFDGTLGRSLVKIVPFGHPLTPLDLEELKRELEARPEEDRPLTIVCLGMELAAQAWVEDWNRLRKGKDAANRIEVIELRTDPKYGKFIAYEPARAKVKVARRKDKIVVEVEDFISPAIVERLKQQGGLLTPRIDDWRAMVDCVMIDLFYNGSVFNVALSDVPEKKAGLVTGRYELPAPASETTVAVKIIDMLGGEILITRIV
jgi:adenine-specific DNA-methyltransferase